MKISIVTPSFNQGQYIQSCIRSVLLQQYRDVEHIIVDGGSSDSTLSIIKAHAIDGRLTWSSEPDGGQGDAVNKGFARVTGDVVGWLNSDDFYFSSSVFQHVVELFRTNPTVDIIYGGMVYVDLNNNVLHVRIPPRFDWGRLTRLAYVVNSNAFIRRSVIDRHLINPNLHFVIDHEYMLRVSRNRPILRTTEVLAGFRVHAGAKSQTLSDDLKNKERRQRNVSLGIEDTATHALLTYLDRAVYRFQLIASDLRWRDEYRKHPPFREFVQG